MSRRCEGASVSKLVNQQGDPDSFSAAAASQVRKAQIKEQRETSGGNAELIDEEGSDAFCNFPSVKRGDETGRRFRTQSLNLGTVKLPIGDTAGRSGAEGDQSICSDSGVWLQLMPRFRVS